MKKTKAELREEAQALIAAHLNAGGRIIHCDLGRRNFTNRDMKLAVRGDLDLTQQVAA